jgi:hypothetical protein
LSVYGRYIVENISHVASNTDPRNVAFDSHEKLS